MTPPDDPDSGTQDELALDEPPVVTIVNRVAEETGRSPLEMEPLHRVIDTEMLNRLFESPPEQDSSLTITFDYCGQRVTVTADDIRVE